MADAFWLLLAAALAAVFGFAWLALAMDVHWEQVHGSTPQVAPTRLRAAGAGALAMSFCLCLGADHPSMAVLVWFMLAAGSAATVAMTLSWRPASLRMIWPVRA